MLALSDGAGLILLGLGALFVVLAVAALVVRNRTKGTGPEIPTAMRPGPSDPVLENPQLTKLQGWGVLLVAFFVVWIPISLLAEPSRNLQQEKNLKTQAIERGSKSVQLFSEENQLGVGCVRCHGPELRGGVIQNGVNADGSPKYAYPPNLTTVCGGPFGNPPHAAIFSTADIQQVIEEGRVANGMPSWSIRYQGALDDMQINDIVNYLVWMSSKNVPFKDNVCLNPDASARALEQNNGALNPRDP